MHPSRDNDARSLSGAELQVLQRTLGLEKGGTQVARRNHYVAGADHPAHPTLERLVAQGLMVRREGTASPTAAPCYSATAIGLAAALKAQPRTPRQGASNSHIL